MKPERFIELQKYERELAESGIVLIGGIDEAGRGPLAGPVAAGCVFYNTSGPFVPADDSKKLSEKKREELYGEITANALSWGVGLASAEEIDEMNILNATKLAMKRALDDAASRFGGKYPEKLLIDHVSLPAIDIPQLSITHGDAISVSIASASIIAKVTRDRLMAEYAKEYPEYGFEKHKGYGTAAHYAAIREYGPSPIHRKTFLKTIH